MITVQILLVSFIIIKYKNKLTENNAAEQDAHKQTFAESHFARSNDTILELKRKLFVISVQK